ncbi:hypothetical protein EVAR_54864_1 [Eumeta japonica]|uniref:Uncharacterized protein n=1 Tax=Eumeta variegata TaxID=151549 RepID=A0A4C1YG91_EUMVA|nr:hypothetical protein EVAR_54864_1 [Eumeta japonica]
MKLTVRLRSVRLTAWSVPLARWRRADLEPGVFFCAPRPAAAMDFTSFPCAARQARHHFISRSAACCPLMQLSVPKHYAKAKRKHLCIRTKKISFANGFPAAARGRRPSDGGGALMTAIIRPTIKKSLGHVPPEIESSLRTNKNLDDLLKEVNLQQSVRAAALEDGAHEWRPRTVLPNSCACACDLDTPRRPFNYNQSGSRVSMKN